MWAPAPPATSGGRPAPITCGWCWRMPNAKPPSQTTSKPWSRTGRPRSAPWAPTIPRQPTTEHQAQLTSNRSGITSHPLDDEDGVGDLGQVVADDLGPLDQRVQDLAGPGDKGGGAARPGRAGHIPGVG